MGDCEGSSQLHTRSSVVPTTAAMAAIARSSSSALRALQLSLAIGWRLALRATLAVLPREHGSVLASAPLRSQPSHTRAAGSGGRRGHNGSRRRRDGCRERRGDGHTASQATKVRFADRQCAHAENVLRELLWGRTTGLISECIDQRDLAGLSLTLASLSGRDLAHLTLIIA